MLIGSIWTGRWIATLIDPPVTADALAEAPALSLAPADSDAAGAVALGVPELQAAMTMLTAEADKPITAARWMN
jgi:hypothetical protein